MQLSTLTLASALSALATLTSATGCYGAGLRLGEVGGEFSSTADVPTVMAMIDTFCGKIHGTTYYPGTGSWKACANTQILRGRTTELYCGQTCRDGCAAIGRSGGRGGSESAGAFCAAGCPPCTNVIGQYVSFRTKAECLSDDNMISSRTTSHSRSAGATMVRQ